LPQPLSRCRALLGPTRAPPAMAAADIAAESGRRSAASETLCRCLAVRPPWRPWVCAPLQRRRRYDPLDAEPTARTLRGLGNALTDMCAGSGCSAVCGGAAASRPSCRRAPQPLATLGAGDISGDGSPKASPVIGAASAKALEVLASPAHCLTSNVSYTVVDAVSPHHVDFMSTDELKVSTTLSGITWGKRSRRCGPRLDQLVRTGDVLKILRPTFDTTRIVNVADHVMLVIRRPKVVAVIKIDEPTSPIKASSPGGGLTPSYIEIFEVACLESSHQLAFFERRTYWVVASPIDMHLAIVDPGKPGNVAEWERISVLNSPLQTAWEEDEVIEVSYDSEHDLAVDVQLHHSVHDSNRAVRGVRRSGRASSAGIMPGDHLTERFVESDGSVLAIFRSDIRRKKLDEEAFENAVSEVEQQKLGWSLRTASRAVMSKAVGNSRFCKDEYAGEAGMQRMSAELRAHWAKDPICTTVPIRVWQRYLFEVWDGDDMAAAAEVLRVMPCRGDRTLPSELWAALLETGLWSEVELLPEYWDSNESGDLGNIDTETAADPAEPFFRRPFVRADTFSIKGMKVYHLAPEAWRRARLQAARSNCRCHIGGCSVQ